MKVTLRCSDGWGKQCQVFGVRGCWFYLQVVILLILLLFLLALSKTMCVYFPLLMWLRKDACGTWEETDFVRWGGELTDWQRGCLLERDWKHMDYTCKDTRLMGNWPVCFDEPYTPVKPGEPCIVYSFGIAYDFRFDDAMAIFNCTVYSFDPSMRIKDHKRSSNVYFKQIGIGAEDDTNFVPRADGYAKSTDRWKVLTLKTIMKMLGHTSNSVSVLKLDVESNEWAVLTNLLEEGILQQLPQVLIEWHIFTDSPAHHQYKKMHEDYTRMKEIGFKKFWMRNEGRNHWLPKFLTQAETAYVNSNFVKPKVS